MPIHPKQDAFAHSRYQVNVNVRILDNAASQEKQPLEV
jgi:hypothetical protein